MKYAIVNNNDKVVNVVVTSPSHASGKENWFPAVAGVEPGDSYDRSLGTYSKPAPSANKARRAVKQTVKELLRRTDWTQVPDNLGAARQTAWKAWRTELRSLIASAEADPFNVVFPDPPGDLDEDGL